MPVSLAKEERLQRANDMLEAIASCGRRFFHHEGRVSRLERDPRGKIWFIDCWSEKRIYTHYVFRWRGFSQGGTMKDLVKALRDFVVHGKQLHPRAFGPWPDWYCGGDLWGYGGDMEKVRSAALRLGIVPEAK